MTEDFSRLDDLNDDSGTFCIDKQLPVFNEKFWKTSEPESMVPTESVLSNNQLICSNATLSNLSPTGSNPNYPQTFEKIQSTGNTSLLGCTKLKSLDMSIQDGGLNLDLVSTLHAVLSTLASSLANIEKTLQTLTEQVRIIAEGVTCLSRVGRSSFHQLIEPSCIRSFSTSYDIPQSLPSNPLPDLPENSGNRGYKHTDNHLFSRRLQPQESNETIYRDNNTEIPPPPPAPTMHVNSILKSPRTPMHNRLNMATASLNNVMRDSGHSNYTQSFNNIQHTNSLSYPNGPTHSAVPFHAKSCINGNLLQNSNNVFPDLRSKGNENTAHTNPLDGPSRKPLVFSSTDTPFIKEQTLQNLEAERKEYILAQQRRAQLEQKTQAVIDTMIKTSSTAGKKIKQLFEDEENNNKNLPCSRQARPTRNPLFD